VHKHIIPEFTFTVNCAGWTDHLRNIIWEKLHSFCNMEIDAFSTRDRQVLRVY